ncbi:MAG: hypothetical protein M1823_000326 [Watsoniomyces obsoletus]|nr:MAG: hypothetical protein M1823_000326 [Watsoniomyces obsoletus]
MPRNNWIDRKSAKTFQLVYRPQDDPLIHDEEASSMVFKEVTGPKQKKIKTRDDLEDELGLDVSSVRDNEGEAANYGVFYDDTNYDYMQHMRDLGTTSEGRFIEAAQRPDLSRKGKGRQTLEDALKDATLDDDDRISMVGSVAASGAGSLLDSEMGSSIMNRSTGNGNQYQSQQNVPDALAGFQPDMDPRLREVLEALEDEAYLDDEDETFAELAKDRKEVPLEEFEMGSEEYSGENLPEMDDGWETDDTTKPAKEYKKDTTEGAKDGDGDVNMAEAAAETETKPNWMAEYGKFKAGGHRRTGPTAPNAELQSSIMTSSSMTSGGGRRKKRKGALTSSTSYSMTSSSLQRTEGLTLLDDRFDQIEKLYTQTEDDEDGEEEQEEEDRSVITTASSSLGPSAGGGGGGVSIRSDLDSMMDEFLGSYSLTGKNKKRVRRGGNQSGLEQLDEIRRDLGPAHIRAPKRVVPT